MCLSWYSNIHKGIKCPDISTRRIYISCDVLFDESIFLLPLYTLRLAPTIDQMSYSHPPPTLGIIILLIWIMFMLYPFCLLLTVVRRYQIQNQARRLMLILLLHAVLPHNTLRWHLLVLLIHLLRLTPRQMCQSLVINTLRCLGLLKFPCQVHRQTLYLLPTCLLLLCLGVRRHHLLRCVCHVHHMPPPLLPTCRPERRLALNLILQADLLQELCPDHLCCSLHHLAGPS
jgi:hypothetical protein